MTIETIEATESTYERVALTRKEIENFQVVFASLSSNLAPGQFFEVLGLTPHHHHSHSLYSRFLDIGHGLQCLDSDTLTRLANAYSNREV